jgi:alcohol dehydrogenase YqhD (iron-dependent ADH family)
MENFVMYNPVKLHFGDGVTDEIGKVTSEYGRRVLLVMGKGSARSSGAYDQVIHRLQEAGLEITEYSGIKSNPVITDVEKAAQLGKKVQADVIVAIGGGSVIDSAKVISLAMKYEGPAWDLVIRKAKPADAVPVIAVLTLAATGTEMNQIAVVQDTCKQEKIGFGHKLMYPKHSFLDPVFTMSVPREYTAYGVVDLIAHALEIWFGEGDASLSDRFIISIIKEGMQYGPDLIENLNNYDLRARIMYAATCALNGMTNYGKKSGDWAAHGISHCLSVLYDLPHGASLSIAFPAWLKLIKDRHPERIHDLGRALFETSDIDQVIYKLEYFFRIMGSPIRLKDVNINVADILVRNRLKHALVHNKVTGNHYKLTEQDYEFLIDLMNGQHT